MKKNFKTMLLIAMGTVLIIGVADIFSLRFSRGDLYPEYSSLRPDPFGCKALYESLEEIEIDVERTFNSADAISDKEHTTLIRTGIHSFRDPFDGKALRDFVFEGGHFIAFFAPDATTKLEKRKYAKKKLKKESKGTPCDIKKNKINKKKNDEKTDKKIAKKNEDCSNCDKTTSECDIPKKFTFSFMSETGFEIRARRESEDEEKSALKLAIPTIKYKDEKFKSFPTFSRNFFIFTDKSKWKVIFTENKLPVLASRNFGKGRITICVSSYLVSNEGLAKLENSKLISHIIPPGRKTLFDEHFLGLKQVKNIAWLFKKYKLQLLIANLILAAAFFVWRNMASMSNISTTQAAAYYETETVESDFSNSDGLRNLIRRSVGKKELTRVCLAEWRKTVKMRNIPKDKIKEIEEIVKKHENADPVQVYKLISEVLK